jgi:hypothetical protein
MHRQQLLSILFKVTLMGPVHKNYIDPIPPFHHESVRRCTTKVMTRYVAIIVPSLQYQWLHVSGRLCLMFPYVDSNLAGTNPTLKISKRDIFSGPLVAVQNFETFQTFKRHNIKLYSRGQSQGVDAEHLSKSKVWRIAFYSFFLMLPLKITPKLHHILERCLL